MSLGYDKTILFYISFVSVTIGFLLISVVPASASGYTLFPGLFVKSSEPQNTSESICDEVCDVEGTDQYQN